MEREEIDELIKFVMERAHNSYSDAPIIYIADWINEFFRIHDET